MIAAWLGTGQVAHGQCEWEETQKLIPSHGEFLDWFAESVAVDGTVLAVGAPLHDDNSTDSGAVFVYRNSGSNWVEEIELLPSDGATDDQFGYSIAISGNLIVVGTPHDDDNGDDSGSVYIFRYDGSNWVEETKLIAPNIGDINFGRSVSIDNTTIAIGSGNLDFLTSTYVFQFDGSNWVEETKLTDPDFGDNDFGHAVSIDNGVIVIGTYGFSGSAYVFRYDNLNWIYEAKLVASDSESWDGFGASVSIDNNIIVVGAEDDDNDDLPDTGSAYIFRYDDSNWIEESKLLASDKAAFDDFGSSVSVNGDTIAIGAKHTDDGSNNSGSAYVFQYNGAAWIEETKLLASDGGTNDFFGTAIAINDDEIITGAPGYNITGSAYVFDLINCPTLTVSPAPLLAGQDGTFTAEHMNPSKQTYLAYSLGGLGSTFIPQLNITLDLSQPAQAGNTITSDIEGTAEWVLPIPGIAAGRDIWFQACQYEVKTNVVATNIE